MSIALDNASRKIKIMSKFNNELLYNLFYGAIGFDPSGDMEENAATAASNHAEQVAPRQSLRTLIAKAIRVWKTEGKRAVIRKVLYELAARI